MNKELIKNKLLIEISNGRESLNQKIRERKKERETVELEKEKKEEKERKRASGLWPVVREWHQAAGRREKEAKRKS